MFGFDPSPAASGPDPFGPLPVKDFPPPPGWLFPVTMGIAVCAFVGFAVLLLMWRVARRKSAAAFAASHPTPTRWIDLNQFDPKRDARRPKSPKVVRPDEDDGT